MLAIVPCPCDDDYIHLSIVCTGVVPSKTPEEVPGTAIDIAEKEELKALAEKAELVARFKTKSDSIREVLARNHIKVVFFGR